MNDYFDYEQLKDKLKFKFEGFDEINSNYSKAFQDIFVLSLLNGKRNGTYVEIGLDHASDKNNTYLLETKFDWKGICFTGNYNNSLYYNISRENKCIHSILTKENYSEYLNENLPDQIDYLQIQVKNSEKMLDILEKVYNTKHNFSIVTLNNRFDDFSAQSHQLLLRCGYKLVVKNVQTDYFDFENWYVNPNVVDNSIIKIFKNTSDSIKSCFSCMFNE